MRRSFTLCASVFLLLFLAVTAANAQLTTANLSGTVKDTAGAVVPNAEVTAIHVATHVSRKAITNERGEYRIEFLPIGEYSVEVTAPAFNKSVQNGILLELNQNGRLDAVLKPGTVQEVVEVTSTAPLVNTNNAEIGTTISNVQIQQLPLVGRNAYELLNITPGVQSSSSANSLGYPEQKVMINGGSDGNYTGTVNYFLDGGTNMSGLRNAGNALPNPDAIQEFRVQTNAYSAEYGRFANGVVNVVTKSGTNQFHGTGYEFWRNDALNATSWNPGGAGKGALHRNQFGFTLGGPIKKDKTFFFGSYAGLRQNTSSLQRAIVPTDLERQGNFTQTLTKDNSGNVVPVTILDPISKKTISCGGVNNVICPDRMDPVALNILKLVPRANSPNNYYTSYFTSPYNSNDVLVKIDHQLSAQQQLSGSYFTTSGLNTIKGGGSNIPWGTEWSRQQYTWRQQNLNLSDTYTINSNLVNQAWFVYSRIMGARVNLPGTSLADFGSTFRPQGDPSLPQISVSSYFTYGAQIAGPQAGTNLYSLRDILSISKGRHNLRVGGEIALEKDVQTTLLNNYGSFSFSGSMTANSKLKETGNGLADFFFGFPNSVNQDSPAYPSTSSWNTAFFVQDDFRVHPRLTLNMGLRWDIQTAPKDSNDLQSAFVPGQQSTVRPDAPVGLVFPGDKGIPRGIIPTRWGHFSPRIGFAYDPWGDGKTSIRGGAGIFWATVSANEWNQTSNFQPFATRLSFTNAAKTSGATLSDPYRNYTGGAPFPYRGQFNNGGSLLSVAPNFDFPYTYQLNFSVQRQVTATTSAAVAYVGSITHDLPFSYDLNYPTLTATSGTPVTKSNVQNRRPNQSFGAISQTQSNQNSWYHSLQLTGNKRLSHHVTFTTSYVFSKTLCTAQIQGGSTGVAQNMSKLWEDRGRCDSDIRHAFNLGLVFQPDYYHGDNKLIRNVLNGWQISPIVRKRSGSPFSVMNGKDANGDGSNQDRANLIGNPHVDHPSTDMWFNTAAFQYIGEANITAPGVTAPDGNSPRNFLEGPGSTNIDMALSRTFKLHEQLKLEFRGEATNAFNIVNLGDPGANISSSNTFGKITGAGGMRQMQLGLKLTF